MVFQKALLEATAIQAEVPTKLVGIFPSFFVGQLSHGGERETERERGLLRDDVVDTQVYSDYTTACTQKLSWNVLECS